MGKIDEKLEVTKKMYKRSLEDLALLIQRELEALKTDGDEFDASKAISESKGLCSVTMEQASIIRLLNSIK